MCMEMEIETLSLRDYIDKEIARLQASCLKRCTGPVTQESLLEMINENSQCIALQEIAYRLEFGFITEIGKTSLKHLLEHR